MAKAATPETDAACQTDPVVAPLVPLPMQYPANLLYAQSMLAISVSQLQQVELSVAQLRLNLHIYEQQNFNAAAAAAAVAAVLKGTVPMSAGGTCQQTAAVAPVVEAPAAVAPGVAAAAEANGNANAGDGNAAIGPDGEPVGQVRVHRRRIAAAVKIALFMILLDLRAGWFFLYFFAAFLYIGGLFDPLIEWVSRPVPQQTLDQQLTALRNRQRAASTAGSAPATAATGASGGGTPANAAERTPAADGTPANTDAATAAVPDVQAPPAEPPPPPYAHRFIYQLVVMFFMTLLPWWNPNPRYTM